MPPDRAPLFADKSGWDVLVRSGKESTGRDVVEWAKEAVLRGAGEILLTSFDRYYHPPALDFNGCYLFLFLLIYLRNY
jgi:imidazole glycerol phosphate synthase subunit HisF